MGDRGVKERTGFLHIYIPASRCHCTPAGEKYITRHFRVGWERNVKKISLILIIGIAIFVFVQKAPKLFSNGNFFSSELSSSDYINFYGEYEWNAKGGTVHWTHHDPSDGHEGG